MSNDTPGLPQGTLALSAWLSIDDLTVGTLRHLVKLLDSHAVDDSSEVVFAYDESQDDPWPTPIGLEVCFRVRVGGDS